MAEVVQRVRYGSHPSQWGELHRPAGDSKGVVVVIHGGFWKAEYDATLGAPLAVDLAERGWTAWNIEYRRVRDGGGFPATLDDVATAIDLLAELDLDSRTVLTLGHSAGGHLATWAAARGRWERWEERVPVTGVVSQAGVLDLDRAFRDRLGSGAVAAFMAGEPDETWASADPRQQVPLPVPVHCVHGEDDDVVPLSQSEEYVAAARAAGAVAQLHRVEGDHFVVIDPTSAAWTLTLGVLDGLR